MKVRALFLALLIGLAVSASSTVPAAAGSPRALAGGVVVPAEWSGIWSIADSVYDCSGAFQSYETGRDTLCTGQVIDQIYDTQFQLECTASVNGTTVEQHCTGSGPIEGTACSFAFTLDSVGTRTGDSFVITSTILTEVTGAAPECSAFPGSCTRTVTRGTRTAPEPTAYCATPVAPTTWGRMKSQYR
jgi:hypothetical protein